MARVGAFIIGLLVVYQGVVAIGISPQAGLLAGPCFALGFILLIASVKE